MKKGAASQESNKDIMRLCREKTRRVEAHLATAVKDNIMNVSINTLTTKQGLRRISFIGWLGKLRD